jgi:hypothetical protein
LAQQVRLDPLVQLEVVDQLVQQVLLALKVVQLVQLVQLVLLGRQG